MNLPCIFLSILFAARIVVEIIVNLRARFLRKKSLGSATKVDQGSVRVLFGGMYIFIAIEFFLSLNGIGLMPTWLPCVGNVVMGLGIIIRYSAIMQLRRYLSTTVQVASDQTIIQSGWYRKIRHPADTGG
ncbi:MAG: hypothetical protein OWS74_01625 [Firmicutes bacterium]|nr:hypothetical protein [Bacillota bacterium]